VATVLIVDDLVANAQVLARLLKRAGHQAHVVGSGPDALVFLTEHVTDLVLLDVMMPGMDGMETLRAMRTHPDNHNVRVLMYSADGAPERVREAEALGAQGYIVKGSTSWPQLEETINRHLQ
jgi:CheY-like chemotaxis protein